MAKRGGGKGALIQKDKSGTLACHNDQTLYEPYSTSKGSYHTRANEGKASTLMATDYKDPPTICGEQTDKRIRRLTPLECCRLQGFPDNWCDGIKHSDSAEYKMWGNGMSLPCAKYVMEGIVEDMRGKKNDT